MEVRVDTDKCIGSGSCEMLAPEVFEVGEDGLVHLLDPTPGSELADRVRAAAANCPTSAISVDE